MNVTYRLVWNVALRAVQVASELASSPARTIDGAPTRRHARRSLYGALLALGCVASPGALLAQSCPVSDVSACSAKGGTSASDRVGYGGAGNGQGGSAVTIDGGGFAGRTPGASSTDGVGGKGADGIDLGNPVTMGGAGGATGSGGGNDVVGGRGGDGAGDVRTPSAGGGGGAALYMASGQTGLVLSSGLRLTGGAGGTGGAPAFNSAAGGGGGGGGGTGLRAAASGLTLTIAEDVLITGGAGGAGGSVSDPISFGGGGGGGGDGLLSTGFLVSIDNHGSIVGGVGGVGGAGGASATIPGGAGDAGAGVRSLGASLNLTNAGSIVGGNGTGSGAAGVGVIAQGGSTIINLGTLAGGVAGGARASSVLFNGNTNLLLLGTDSVVQGAVELASGADATIVANSDRAIDGIVLDGGGAHVDLVGAGALDIGRSIVGTGDVTSSGGARRLRGANLAGSLTFTGPSTIGIQGTITTAGAQSYGGPVQLNAGTSASSTGGSITFGSTLDGASVLNATASGTIAFQGAVGGGTPLAGLAAIAGSLQLNSIRTGALSLVADTNLTQTGAFVATGAATLYSNDGDVALTNAGNRFQGTVDVAGRDVALDSASALNLSRLRATGSATVRTAGGLLLFTGDTTVADTLAIASTGNVTQTAGTLTAGRLEVQAVGDVHLDDLNAIAAVGNVITPGVFSLATSGATTIDGAVDVGTLLLGGFVRATLTGSLDAAAIDLGASALLAVQRPDDVVLNGTLSGSGTLVKQGAGDLVLEGNGQAFTGDTIVLAGGLVVGGNAGSTAALGGPVTVRNGASLGGHGRIGGSATLESGATLSPGRSIGTLTVDGDLTLAQGSVMDAELGAPGSGDSVSVGGDLTIDGTTLNITDAGGMAPGIYNVFSYGGTLTTANGGLLLGAVPAGHHVTLRTLTGDKRIDLVDFSNATLNYWNANGLADATRMGGGSGTWSVTSPAWTDAQGSVTAPMLPQPGFAIFGGDAGTVTIDGSAGAVTATGLQFVSDGYRLTGAPLTLTAAGGPVFIRVGDGSAASAGAVATIDAVLDGSAGFTKTDAGTLALDGANVFTGTVGIAGGVVAVGDDGNLGDRANGIALGGGTLRVTGTSFTATDRALALAPGGGIDIADASNTFAWNGAIGGAGGVLHKLGAGTLVLDHANAYGGGTVVDAGATPRRSAPARLRCTTVRRCRPVPMASRWGTPSRFRGTPRWTWRRASRCGSTAASPTTPPPAA